MFYCVKDSLDFWPQTWERENKYHGLFERCSKWRSVIFEKWASRFSDDFDKLESEAISFNGARSFKEYLFVPVSVLLLAWCFPGSRHAFGLISAAACLVASVPPQIADQLRVSIQLLILWRFLILVLRMLFGFIHLVEMTLFVLGAVFYIVMEFSSKIWAIVVSWSIGGVFRSVLPRIRVVERPFLAGWGLNYMNSTETCFGWSFWSFSFVFAFIIVDCSDWKCEGRLVRSVIFLSVLRTSVGGLGPFTGRGFFDVILFKLYQHVFEDGFWDNP